VHVKQTASSPQAVPKENNFSVALAYICQYPLTCKINLILSYSGVTTVLHVLSHDKVDVEFTKHGGKLTVSLCSYTATLISTCCERTMQAGKDHNKDLVPIPKM
jgi:hypothetical protein